MFPQIINKLCCTVTDSRKYRLRHLPQTAAYLIGFTDALLDALTMMGHKVAVECDECVDGCIIYADITVDGLRLVTDDIVDDAAKLELLAANKEKED